MKLTIGEILQGLAFWLLVAGASLAFVIKAQGQYHFADPNLKWLAILGSHGTQQWLHSPHVSPYLLLDDPNPFDESGEIERLYLLVKPRLELQDLLRRNKLRMSPAQPPWIPYHSTPNFTPYPLRKESTGASRFMDFGSYYKFPNTPTSSQIAGGIDDWQSY